MQHEMVVITSREGDEGVAELLQWLRACANPPRLWTGPVLLS
jgi:hypothetical protein